MQSSPKDIENWEQDEDVLDTWSFILALAIGYTGGRDDAMEEKVGLFLSASTSVTVPDIIFFLGSSNDYGGCLNLKERSYKPNQLIPEDEISSQIPFKNV